MMVGDTLERIIGRPLVQKSKQANVPAWLALPTCVCLALGGFFTFAQQSVLNYRESASEVKWIGPLYLATGLVLTMGMVLGSYSSNTSILSTSQKRQKLVTASMFIGSMALAFLLLFALLVACILLSLALDHLALTPRQRGSVACFLDPFDDCTNCDGTVDRCPEWSVEDVRSVLQTQIKASATVAAIFILHSFSVFRFGLTLRRHIATYQIGFV